MSDRRALGAGAAATALVAILYLAKWPWAVGPPSWRWAYKSTALWPAAIVPAMLFGLLLVVAMLWTRESGAGRRREALFLALLALLSPAFDLAFLAMSPLRAAALLQIHAVPWITGYFWSARVVPSLSELLASYPDVVTHLTHHAKTHPPGLVSLNWLALDWFRGSPGATDALLSAASLVGIHDDALPGASRAELAGLVFVGGSVVVLSRLALVPAYILARRVCSVPAARSAVLILALVPSTLHFAGQFDAAFPLLILTALCLAGRPNGRIGPAAAGALVGVLCLMTFVATFFLLLVGVVDLFLARSVSYRGRFWRLVWLGVGFVMPLALFELATGCSIPRVFIACYTIAVGVLIPEQQRVWTTWVFWNLVDFFVFLGPPIAVLFGREVLSVARTLRSRAAPPAFSLAVIVFLLALDLSGQIPAETSRVWLFLVAPVVIATMRNGPPAGRAGLALLLCLQFAFALLGKATLGIVE